MTAGRLQSGVNTLQGFKEDKRNKVTPGKAPTWSSSFFFSLSQGAEEKKHSLYGIFAILISYFIKKKLKNQYFFFLNLFIFGCVGSLLLCVGFL